MNQTSWYKNNAHRLYRRGWVEWRHVTAGAFAGIAIAALIYVADPVFHIPGHNWLGHLNIVLLVIKAAADAAIYSASRKNKTPPRWNVYDGIALACSAALAIIMAAIFFYETNYSASEHEKYAWTNYNIATRFTSLGNIIQTTEVSTDYRVFRYALLALSSGVPLLLIGFTG